MSKRLASQPCSVCEGEGALRCTLHDDHQFDCPECGGVGVVPLEDNLAQWREKAEAMLDTGYPWLLRAHLAAMPAQDPNAELLVALEACLLCFTRLGLGLSTLPEAALARTAIAQVQKVRVKGERDD